MTEPLVLHLPPEVVQRIRTMAMQSHRPVEDLLIQWMNRASSESPPVDNLPDDEILRLCDLQLLPAEQTELSELLARSREDVLDEASETRLDTLMQHYRQGLVRKAQAWKVAVARKLRSPLN